MVKKKKPEPPPRRSKASQPGKPTSARTRSIAPPLIGDESPVIGEAAEEVADPPAESREAVQAPLIPDSEIAVREPETIQNDRMAATFLTMTISRDKEDDPLVSLSFSMVLTDKHDEFTPEKVAIARRWLLEQDNKGEMLQNIPSQTVDVFDEPKAKKPIFHLVGATVSNARVEMVEETGKGQSKKVIRFKWSLTTERDDDVKEFGWENDQRQFWLEMKDTQATL